MRYFENLVVESEIKARYKDLAKAHHPDLGGCVEVMKEINRQYDEVLTGAYQKAGKSITEIEELLKNAQDLRDKLADVVAMPGVVVELVGEWIWVTGLTKPVKELLKSAKFMWSNKKTAWYWRAEDKRSRRYGGEWDLDKIKERHGCEKLTSIRRSQAIA